MSDGLRIDGDGVAGLTARWGDVAASWDGPPGATTIRGVGSGVLDLAVDTSALWRAELTTAASGLVELVAVVDAAVTEVARTDGDLARAAQGRDPRDA